MMYDRVANSFTRQRIMGKRHPTDIERFPAVKQRRLDKLLDKNSEGTIKPQEKARLEQLVAEAARLLVANAKRLAKLARGNGKPVGCGSRSRP
jgi:hypothetical protein